MILPFIGAYSIFHYQQLHIEKQTVDIHTHLQKMTVFFIPIFKKEVTQNDKTETLEQLRVEKERAETQLALQTAQAGVS